MRKWQLHSTLFWANCKCFFALHGVSSPSDDKTTCPLLHCNSPIKSADYWRKIARNHISSRVGKRIVLTQKHSSGVFPAESAFRIKKNQTEVWFFLFMLALPIFPGSRPPSIVGVHELNFCVRDGNRWTLMTINTNYDRWLFTILCQMTFVI